MSAADRGWGAGWPNCQRDKIVSLSVAGVSFPGGVRREVKPLFAAFALEFHRTVEPLRDGWCWGFACRAIGGTRTPSNHSWGLALDLNAPDHPWGASGTFTAAQARQCRVLAKKYGLRWGGDYSRKKDEMHFEFMGTPQDAARINATLGVELEGAEMLTTNSPDSEAIKRHQLALMAWSDAALPEYGADSDYGSETEGWVKRYQKAMGLPQTGTIGGVTSALLLSELDSGGSGVLKHDHNDLYVTKDVYGKHRHDEGRTGGPQ